MTTTTPATGRATFTTPYQAPAVRVGNVVGRAAAMLGAETSLAPDGLLAEARRRTGLRDFGPEPLDAALGRLTDSYERDAHLHPAGRMLVRRLLVRHLARRLEIVELHRRDPALRTRAVARPVVVVGLPRTGTTLLHNLLAQHDRARPLLAWEAFDPVPRGSGGAGQYRRIRDYRRQVALLNHLAPDIRTVHELVVDGPEECLSLLARSMLSHGYLLGARLTSYESWLLDQPTDVMAGAYRLHRAQLQVLDAQRDAGHWVLKSPAHLMTLEALLRVYPDARIVHLHRRLSEVVASSASLIAVGRSVTSDQVDARALGREMLEQGERLVERVLDQRSRIPDENILDVRYEDLMADPVATLDRIHDHFDVPTLDGAAAGVAAYLAARPQHRNGVHRYSLRQFGIDPGTVDGLARAYHERFDIPAPALAD